MIEGHGNDIYLYEDGILADFSSNVSAWGMPDELSEYLKTCIEKVINYPEPDAKSLQLKIAKHHSLSNDNILVTNGSTEAFYTVAHLFRNKSSTVFTPSFSEYEDAVKMFGHTAEFVPNSTKLSSLDNKTGLLWLGNPNNPDGKVIQKEDIFDYCSRNPDVIVILDEAYAELCYGFESCLPFVKDVKNIIVIRSLTKVFSIPGIRLGYMAMNQSFFKTLSAMRVPWNVNSLAIEAGLYIMDNYYQLLPDKMEITRASLDFQRMLNDLEELEVRSSKCNFFLVKLLNRKSADLKEFLVKEHGLLIRDASNFRGLDESYIRLSVQKPEFNQEIIEAVRKWMHKN